MTLSLLPYDFDEVRIFDDKLNDIDIIRKIIAIENLEDPFHLFDVGDVVRKHRLWLDRIPRVVPHYAVKCNPNSTVIKTLAALGASFDCASKQEIVQVMAYGVPAERIIFANPIKTPCQIKYAQKVGVSKMTVDSMWELRKIKEFYPEAKVIIRFRCDASVSDAYLGLKFGCEPGEEAKRLIRGCRDLGLDLHGFSFHVGSPCGEVMALSRGIGLCRELIDVAHLHGFRHVQLIDIGGGIPGEADFVLDEVLYDHLKGLRRPFLLRDLLFEYRHLVFWFPEHYRATWRCHRRALAASSSSTSSSSTTRRTVTTTFKSTTAALPWRP